MACSQLFLLCINVRTEPMSYEFLQLALNISFLLILFLLIHYPSCNCLRVLLEPVGFAFISFAYLARSSNLPVHFAKTIELVRLEAKRRAVRREANRRAVRPEASRQAVRREASRQNGTQ